jgi:putative ABC transport system substrate-binding protein
LGALKPRAIIAGATAVRYVHTLLPEIPLVFTGYAADPIKPGFVDSYARPGGMSTGNVMNALGGEEAITQKRIGYFKELVPGLMRLGMIEPPNNGLSAVELDALQKVSVELGFELRSYAIRTLDDLEGAFESGRRDGVNAF